MEVPLLAGDFLRRAVKLYPGQEAVVDGELRLTYAEFGARREPARERAAGARRRQGRPRRES